MRLQAAAQQRTLAASGRGTSLFRGDGAEVSIEMRERKHSPALICFTQDAIFPLTPGYVCSIRLSFSLELLCSGLATGELRDHHGSTASEVV